MRSPAIASAHGGDLLAEEQTIPASGRTAGARWVRPRRAPLFMLDITDERIGFLVDNVTARLRALAHGQKGPWLLVDARRCAGRCSTTDRRGRVVDLLNDSRTHRRAPADRPRRTDRVTNTSC